MSIIWPPWPSTFQTDTLVDAGVIGVGANGSFTPLAMTLGGFNFKRGVTYTDTKFDGMRSRVAKLQRITKYDSMFSGKIIQYHGVQYPYLEPGMASASGTGIVSTYWSLQVASQYLAGGSYGNDFRWIFKRADGSYSQIRAHVFLITKADVTAKDTSAAEIDIQVEALVDPTQTNPATGTSYTIADAPYLYEDIYSSASAL